MRRAARRSRSSCGCAFENGGADNGLWFVYAAGKYLGHVKDAGADAETLANGVKQIVDRYLNGVPQLDVVCDSNMLLKLTVSDTARHWMGATAGDEVVVARKGYLVEVNALWYNALKTAEQLTGDKQYGEAAEKCAKSFNDTFWSFDMNGLYDCVDPETFKTDNSIRPNQILAASLPYSPLSPETAQKVVRLCWNELYTTYGLRTLDPRHDKFKGRHNGLPEIQPDEEGPRLGVHPSVQLAPAPRMPRRSGPALRRHDAVPPARRRAQRRGSRRASPRAPRRPRNGSVNFSQSFSFKPPSAV